LLGKLHGTNTCKGTFRTKCKKMVKRSHKIPKGKKGPHQKGQFKIVLKKKVIDGKEVIVKKKKWTLKSRKGKDKNNKQTKNDKKQDKDDKDDKDSNKNSKSKQQNKKEQEKSFINKELSKADMAKLDPKKINKLASKLVSLDKNGKLAEESKKKIKPEEKPLKAILKEGKLSDKGREQSSKKQKSKKGKYCVHGVVWHMQFCCSYKSYDDAQSFANTLPHENKLKDQILKAHLAEKKDKEKKANKTIKEVSKKLEKIDQKADKKEKQATKKSI
jgi:hypothetical protein